MVKLVQPELEQVLAFCGEEPIERVYLEDVARRGIGRFVALADGSRLRALCHVGANVVPAGTGCESFADAVRRGDARMIIGASQPVSELWDALAARMHPREDRPGQPVYLLEEAPEPGDTGLRAARVDDLERLIPACAAAHEQELGHDPLAREADTFRWRTRAQIEEGRSWVWLEDDVILFKAEASAWTPAAVQLQQVWVDPAVRNRGYAKRALRDLCRLLLERVPAVTLFSRRENAAAIRVYEAIGMRHVLDYRSLLL